MKTSKKFAAFGTVLGVSVAGGIAFAAWTADGTGSGYAQAKTAQAVSTVTATPVAGLYPGGTSDLKVSVVNPNDYAVKVTAINGNGDIASPDSTCNASHGVTFTNQTGEWVVPAKSAGTVITLTGAVAMSNASVTDCSGETFTVPVSIAAASHV